MEKKMLMYTTLLAAFLSFVIFSSFNEEEKQNLSITSPDTSGIRQRITGFDLTKGFDFAGEAMPTDNFDPIERLDRELSINVYMHATTLLHIKTANRFFPVIEPILREHGIPDDFKYLCVAESSLRMATSSAGAKGLWQFVELMGRAYDLEMNSEVDERYHVEKSTVAACKFLLYLKNRFGSWTMAAAAYNMGETSLAKRIQEQKSSNYYDLNLNDETSRYIFRIIAIKEIMKNPEAYGFFVGEEQLYEPVDYETVTVNYSIPSLGEFAQQQGTSYRMLKVLNPWLISTSLKNTSGKTYEIRIVKT
jgi:hypothetical protein